MIQEVNQSNKLEKFKNAVFAEIDTKRVQIEMETAALKETQLEINKDNQLNNMYSLIQNNIKDIKKQCRKEVSKFDLQAHREVLLKRAEITNKVFGDVTKRLTDFCKTAKYYDFLKNGIIKVLEDNTIKEPTIFLCQRDMDFADKIKSDVTKSVLVLCSDDILIGGFICKSDKNNVYFDETLDDKITEQKQLFAQNSRLCLTVD
ncbi:MAG: V-type ATP synthase subunit E [Oscillospiraceae bacterium]